MESTDFCTEPKATAQVDENKQISELQAQVAELSTQSSKSLRITHQI